MNVKARKARLAAAIAAAALTAAACGGDASNGDGGDAAAQATTAAPPTTAAPTTTVPPATTAAADEAPTDAMALLIAAIRNSALPSVRGEMHLGMGDMANVAVQFEVDGNQNLSMTTYFGETAGPDGDRPGIEFRFVDGVQYLRYVVSAEVRDRADEAMPEGWFTIDAQTVAEMGMVCPSPAPGETPVGGVCRLPNDLTFMIEHLTGAEFVGQEDLDGLAGAHYRFTVDAAALAAESSAALGGGDGGGDVMAFGGEFGIEELIFDVWIDGNGLVRRTSLDLGAVIEEFMGGAEDTESGGFGDAFAALLDITNVVNYYDYGADITIDTPPADEIVGDLGDMMGPGGFGAG